LNCGTASNGASALVIFDQKVEAVEFSGEAAVLDAFVNITGFQIDATGVTAGPLPPEGGSDSDSVANLNVGNGAITSGTATVSTVGAGNQSFSEAEVEDLNINLLNLISVGASVIRAEAEATCDPDGNASVSSDSEIADLAINTLLGPVNIPASFPPNTVLANLNIAGLGQVKIVVNEQMGSAIGGQGEITVNALHITSTVNIPLVGTVTVVDVVISSAHADIDCEVITPPVIKTRIKDGFDWAWIRRPEPEFQDTVTQSFSFSSASFKRTANLTLFVGDCDADRPDLIIIRTLNSQNNVLTLTNLVDRCSSSDGLKWDTIVVPVEIPVGATKLQVRVRSSKHTTSKATNPTPDSLGWILAAISEPAAQGITFSGRATVARASVLSVANATLGDTGPLPPSGGVRQESGVDVVVPGVISSGTGKARTEGAGNMSKSEASVENLSLNLLSAITASAEVLEAFATAECDQNGNASLSGGSLILNLALSILGNPVNIPGNLPPNTVLVNQNVVGVGLVRIVANEQIVNDNNGTAEITVNALHITIGQGGDLGSIADVVIASSHADISCN
jgi:hypothetical protein